MLDVWHITFALFPPSAYICGAKELDNQKVCYSMNSSSEELPNASNPCCTWHLAELAGVYHSSHLWCPVCHSENKKGKQTKKPTDHFSAITLLCRRRWKVLLWGTRGILHLPSGQEWPQTAMSYDSESTTQTECPSTMTAHTRSTG